MKHYELIIATAALSVLAHVPAWAQSTRPDGNTTPPATTAPVPRPMPKAQPGQGNSQPQPKAQPGQGESRTIPKTQPPQAEPRPTRRMDGEGGTDSRGPAHGQGGTGSTGQGGMPGSGASAGSGGTADTR